MITIKLNRADIDNKIKAMQAALHDETMMKEAANAVVAQILLDVRDKSVDPTGAPLKPYTPKYAKWRAKHKYQTGRRDLTCTGELLSNLKVLRTRPNSATIGWTGKLQIDKAEGNQKWAPFFGISNTARLAAMDIIKRRLISR